MRFDRVEGYRLIGPGIEPRSSNRGDPYGCFLLTSPYGMALRIIACAAVQKSAKGWEHVSVSTETRCPTWAEMCFVKDMFWDENDCVVQFHPPKRDYVNNHPFVLHLWRSTRKTMATPPKWMV